MTAATCPIAKLTPFLLIARPRLIGNNIANCHIWVLGAPVAIIIALNAPVAMSASHAEYVYLRLT